MPQVTHEVDAHHSRIEGPVPFRPVERVFVAPGNDRLQRLPGCLLEDDVGRARLCTQVILGNLDDRVARDVPGTRRTVLVQAGGRSVHRQDRVAPNDGIPPGGVRRGFDPAVTEQVGQALEIPRVDPLGISIEKVLDLAC